MKILFFHTRLLVIFGLVSWFSLSGCSRNHPIKVHPAFYFWKTFYQLDEKDQAFFQSLGVNQVYVRAFDLSWDAKTKQAFPSNEITFSKSFWSPPIIVPVVYITQEAIQNLREQDLGRLAENILTEVQRIVQKMGNTLPREIQIDCDWTPSTRNQYFHLLEAIEKKKTAQSPNLIISATIRLHQVKYFRVTGIPPVEKGVLMVYHTSSPALLDDQSTILNLDLAKDYLRDIEHYPLKLDVALPVFCWIVQFDEHEKFIRILYAQNDKGLDQNPALKKIGRYIYKAQMDGFLGDHRVMKGDVLKLDRAEPKDVLEVLKFLRKRLNNSEINLILFDYDGATLGDNNDTFNIARKIFGNN